jgi:hypothetical protein
MTNNQRRFAARFVFFLSTSLHLAGFAQTIPAGAVMFPGTSVTGILPSNSVSHLVSNGGTLWAGTGRGLASSTNAGRAWTEYGSAKQFGSNRQRFDVQHGSRRNMDLCPATNRCGRR